MRKINLCLLSIFMSISSFSQSQRLVLIEEFTSASCPPSFSTDAPFNILLSQNLAKARSIKYEVNYPSADVINLQNPSEVNSKCTYYAIPAVPCAKVDGQDIVNNCTASGGGFSHAACLDQAYIDAQYNIPSPFTFALSHYFNPSHDSIFITATITCTQNIVMAQPKLQLAIEEEQIHFSNPISTTPMKDFYNQMRKMVPNANGTTIDTIWTVGQTKTLTFTIPVPTYIYNFSQISVIGWIQDDATKNIMQAGYSPPLPIAIDAGVTEISKIEGISCTPTIAPQINLQNFGTSNLTSAQINYSIDNGTVQTYYWTGNLSQGNLALVALPSMSVIAGAHTFYAKTISPNATVDLNAPNDKLFYNFFTLPNVAVTNTISEGFENSAFPSQGWIVENRDSSITWKRFTNAGGFAQSANCAVISFYTYPYSILNTGNKDYLYTESVNFSSATAPQALQFNVAYAQYDTTYVDTLQVEVSVDCGLTWSSVYKKWGQALATAPTSTIRFFPTATQWRTESIDMSAYINEAEVNIRFIGINNYGNDLYIDDINILSPTSVKETSNKATVNIYPNPFSSKTTIEISSFEINKKPVFELYDVLGNKIKTTALQSLQFEFERENLPSGIYYYKVISEKKVIGSGKLITE